MKYNDNKSLLIIEKLKEYYGNVKPSLDYNNIYQLTIAVILSAQTTDNQVNKVTRKLFLKYKNFKQLSKAKKSDVEQIIKSIGLYKTKTKHIIELSKIVMNKYDGQLPKEFEKLIQLPGIGRKSANVIISHGFGEDAIPVDTHVKRVSKRIGLTEANNVYKVEQDLKNKIPKKLWNLSHLLLIYHGRTICKAINPDCPICPVASYCKYYDNNK